MSKRKNNGATSSRRKTKILFHDVAAPTQTAPSLSQVPVTEWNIAGDRVSHTNYNLSVPEEPTISQSTVTEDASMDAEPEYPHFTDFFSSFLGFEAAAEPAVEEPEVTPSVCLMSFTYSQSAKTHR